MADRIQQRRDTAARWAQYNPILLEGEVGYVTDDPNQYKIGDGVHTWNELPLRGFDGTLVHTTGSSTTSVMSQKAVTDEFAKLRTAGYIYAGIATATTNPGTPVEKVFYVATTAGTYTNFGNKAVNNGITILSWNGTSWTSNELISIKSEVGSNENAVMSQKIVSNLLRGETDFITDNIRSPYTFIGNFATWAEVQTELDRLHNSDGGADNKVIGEFRVLLDGRNLLVRSWVQNWATGVFTQTVQGSIQWNAETQTMDQSLNIKTYERRYNEGTGWTTWEEGTAKIELAQELSTEEGSENKAISQKAVSEAFKNGINRNETYAKKEAESLVIKDKDGYEILNIDKDGLSIPTLNVTKEIKGQGINKSVSAVVERTRIRQISSDSDEFAIMDGNGNIVFFIGKNGISHYIEERASITPTKLKADINLILSYGQSLSVYGGNDFGTKVGGVPSVHPYYKNILKFANIDGVDVQTAIKNATDLEALNLNDVLGTEFKPIESGETIHNIGHFALYYDKLLIEKNHYTEEELPKFLLASCGEPGIGIPGLENEQYYNRIIAAVKQGLNIALSNNQSFNVPFLAWLQAEGNYKTDYDGVYKEHLFNLFDKINQDVKAITGQTNDVIFICYNPCTEVYHDITYDKKNDKALQIIEAEQEKNNIAHGSAMHIFGFGDELHTTGNSYKLIGSINALQAYNIVEENREIPILIPVSHSVAHGIDGAYYIQLDYDVMYPPLQFKKPNENIVNANYSKIANHGFRILTSESSDFSTDDTNIIENVKISENGKSIIIRCSQDPKGKVLTYAWDGFYSGGDVCDSASKVLPSTSWTSFNNDTQIFSDVDNYLPIYRLTI